MPQTAEEIPGFNELTPAEQEELKRLMEAPQTSGGLQEAQQYISPDISNLMSSVSTIINSAEGATPDSFRNIGVKGFRTFIDNFLNLPRAVGEGLNIAGSAALAGGPALVSKIKGEDANFVEKFDKAREAGAGSIVFPQAGALKAIPKFDTADLLALEKAIRGHQEQISAINRGLISPDTPLPSFTDTFKKERALQEVKDRANEAVNPISTGLGEIGGDIATLMAGRAPFVKGLSEAATVRRITAAEKELAAADTRLSKVPENIRGRLGELSPGLKARFEETAIDKIIPNLGPNIVKAVGRGTGKAAEAAAEAATLELMKEGDDIKLAAFSAGVQGAGSISLQLTNKLFLGKGGSIGSRALLIVGTSILLHENLKNVLPGKKNIFESKDFAVDTLTAAYLLGTLAAMTGSGRIASEKFPLFADTLTQAGRTTTRDMFKFFSDKQDTLAFKVLGKMSEDPTYFNSNQFNSLGRALLSGKGEAFQKEVSRLLKDSPEFRKKADEL